MTYASVTQNVTSKPSHATHTRSGVAFTGSAVRGTGGLHHRGTDWRDPVY